MTTAPGGQASSIGRRRFFATSAAASVGVAAGLSLAPSGASAAVPGGQTGVNVLAFGATGDGLTDDTLAVKSALTSADGDLVYFPAGTYVLNNLVATNADMLLGAGATLLHKAGSSTFMIAFSGPSLRIRGGVLDGNKDNQVGRPTLIAGGVGAGKQIELEGVHLKDFVRAAIYAHTFGGYIGVQQCLITGQAEHDGITGHATSIINVIAGEAGSKGLLRFNHNRAVGTDTPREAGSNPGGVFFGPVTSIDDGTLATVEAIGNHFWGYGQNCAGNVIAPLHTYPAVSGARYIGNYFEACSFSAISAKSVQELICTDNVVLNGQVSTQNSPREGAICYAPSYHAGSNSRPRAVIQGNIVSNPGGAPDQVQNGICVFGSTTSIAEQIVVSDNVLTGCGMGILVNGARDVLVESNIVTTVTSATSAVYGGIRLEVLAGDVSVRGNRIVCNAGSGIAVMGGVSTARVMVQNNSITSTVSGIFALTIKAAKFAHVTGNEISAVSHAVTIRGDGTVKLGGFYWDRSNMIHSGLYSPVFSEITRCFGEHKCDYPPIGVIVPGEVGTQCTQINGTAGKVLWIATGLKSSNWRLVSLT
jgi:hypothetical protein